MKRFALLFILASCGGAAALPPPVPAAPPPPCPEASGYVPVAAHAKVPTLPKLPDLPVRATKIGDAYTVWGASHHLRSHFHREEVDGKRITLVGTIVRTNYDAAPACSVHATGKADGPNCRAPIPTFVLADEKGETKTLIDVMGWASNFAQMFSMIEAIDKAKTPAHAKLLDEFWGQDLPNPIPGVGARVKVTGSYGVTFTKATSGMAANPKYGIMTAERIEYLEPPPEKVYLRGMKRPKR